MSAASSIMLIEEETEVLLQRLAELSAKKQKIAEQQEPRHRRFRLCGM